MCGRRLDNMYYVQHKREVEEKEEGEFRGNSHILRLPRWT